MIGKQAGYLVFQSDPFSWEVKQLASVAHPSPPLPGAGRSSDIWRQFQQTLPFLPASKNFFEDILGLARKQRAEEGTGERTTFARRSSLREEPFEDPSGASTLMSCGSLCGLLERC